MSLTQNLDKKGPNSYIIYKWWKKDLNKYLYKLWGKYIDFEAQVSQILKF